ncbi:MAG: thermonuclease family protein [Ardenticatenaceae bacterium]|nr:thermonuclease family protein [Anaerolineales bacterium]MCB8920446.1 thermonuclease family protein [Ardenticatenaceae bacterium]MCB8989401.1 thermonuclease family protein [Ardenticatenaceae bacterium]MCB9004556.1 thermonuclease family protein [Ardenticatenaceae bacterium]
MQLNLYTYKAIVQSVYDGDTCTVDIDLGLRTWVHDEKLRLARINAPEVRGEEREAGLRSRDFLRSKIDGQKIVVETIKDQKGKYGRYLAEIWLEDGDDTWVNVNDLLVQEGFAEYKEY